MADIPDGEIEAVATALREANRDALYEASLGLRLERPMTQSDARIYARAALEASRRWQEEHEQDGWSQR